MSGVSKSDTRRIAMWSGPRNLSTAMMYAFGQRADCAVSDEPFYGAYLKATGADHPMADEIIAAGETDPARVAAYCRGPVPGGRAVWYQKHMTHHMLPGMAMDWIADLTNVFLIRHPARVVARYARKREDILADPGAALAALCAEIGIEYDPAMLHWPAGGRAEDGVWAPVWYGAVHRSTGFGAAEPELPVLEGAYADLADSLMPEYRALEALKLAV